MHTTNYERWIANHNSDLSGNVILHHNGQYVTEIPGSLIKEIVAEYIRAQHISRIEDMTVDELLGGESKS